MGDTNSAFDRGRKALLYAVCGVQELRVVEANSRTTYVHRGPTKLGWGQVLELPSTARSGPQLPSLCQLTVCLADWD